MIDQSTVPNVAEIFSKYNTKIYGYVYLRTRKNKAVAEDLTQEIFIKAWQNIDKYNQRKATIATWLYSIARNTVIDYLRQQGNLSGSEVIENQMGDTGSEIEQSILRDFVYDCLTQLDDMTQDLITWRFVQGLETQEIAQIIHKSANATTVAIHRAVNKLRNRVNGQE
jgi:RNA polymerase sigma-70 factor (ECF subfamily)